MNACDFVRCCVMVFDFVGFFVGSLCGLRVR